MSKIQQALDKARASGNLSQPQRKKQDNAGRARHIRVRGDLVAQHAIPVDLSNAHLASNRVITPSSELSMVAQYKILRTQLLQKMAAMQVTALGITSVMAGEGKSLTTANLAISIAMHTEKSVLLVDADLRKPSVHQKFGMDMDQQPGLSELLQGKVGLSEVLYKPDNIERFYLLPAGERVDHSSELLETKAMKDLYQNLVQSNPDRIVLFDLPPVLAGDDVMTMAHFMPAFLFVVEEGRPQQHDLLRCLDVVGRERIVGTVMNKANRANKGYYYYYYYGSDS